MLQQGFSKSTNSLYFQQRFSKSDGSLYVPTRIFQTNKPLVCLVVEMFSFQSNEFFPPLKTTSYNFFLNPCSLQYFWKKVMVFQTFFLSNNLPPIRSFPFPINHFSFIKSFFFFCFHVHNQTNQQLLVESKFVLRLLEEIVSLL